MYRIKDRKTRPLFPELFPFGGKLDESNRWLRISELIPWEELEEAYAKHFSDVGRPATDAQLVIGLLLLKHMTGLSDEGIAQEKRDHLPQLNSAPAAKPPPVSESQISHSFLDKGVTII